MFADCAEAKSCTLSKSALSYTFTLHNGEYPSSSGSVETTLCALPVPSSVLNPDGGPPPSSPGFILNVT